MKYLSIVFIFIFSFVLFAQTDTTPPQLVSFSFNPTSINTTTSSRTVTFTIRATDDLSGVEDNVQLVYETPSGKMDSRGLYRTSGNDRDGIYTIPLPFPQYSEPGTWRILRIHITDKANNLSIIEASELTARGFRTELPVTSIADTTPPNIISFAFSPTSINTTNNSQNVNFNVRAIDTQAGISDIGVVLGKDGRSFGAWLTRLSGTSREGIYTGTITMPRFTEQGTWSIFEVTAIDAVGNERIFYTQELADRGYPTLLEITQSGAQTPTPTPNPTVTPTPTPTPTPQNCLFLISPSFQDFSSSGGTGTISVTGQDGCNYSSLNESSFVTLNSGAEGTGNSTVTFTVAANLGAARSVTIFVAGQTFTINQAAYVKSRKRVRFF